MCCLQLMCLARSGYSITWNENKCIGVCNELGCLLYVLIFMSNIHVRSSIPFDVTTMSCGW